MNKKYIVELSPEEQETLLKIIKKQKGTYQKTRRAQILLKADINGLGWTDQQISEAFNCRTRTVENVRRRLVLEGFDAVLNRKERDNPPRKKLLDGDQEAEILTLRLGSPPEGYSTWSLRLLTERVIELGIIDSICQETIRKMLKKTI